MDPCGVVLLSLIPPLKPSSETSIEPLLTIVTAFIATIPPRLKTPLSCQVKGVTEAPKLIVSVSYCGTFTTCVNPAIMYPFVSGQTVISLPVTLCT